MEKEIPVYLKGKAKVIDIHKEPDGAYGLKLLLEAQGQNEFIPFLSHSELTKEEKDERVWIIAFKNRYAHLWAQGYDLTSRTTPEGTIYGCAKNGQFIDLETYKPCSQKINIHPVIVKVKSLKSETEFEIFNNFLYGYDAIISNKEKTTVPVKYKKKSKCRKCGCETYKIYINLHNTGKKDLLKDQPCEYINEENWTNAFDWISIDLECSNCGKLTKQWFEMETM